MATKPKATSADKAPPADEGALDYKDLRVIEFGVENFMRVRAVTIRPETSLVELTGKNRQGKTSVIRALLSVFTGKGALPMQPIRRGEKESRVWAILGADGVPELTIEEQLTLREDGEVGRKLVVTPAEGRPFREPQQMLNRLYDPIAFAPFDFSRRSAKEQLEVVKTLVPGIDFDKVAKKRKDIFDDRTAVGRDRDRQAALVQTLPMPPASTPAQEVNVADLMAKLSEGNEANRVLDQRRRGRDAVANEIEAKRDEIDQTRARLAALIAEVDAAQAKLDGAEPLPDPVNVAPIEEAIASAQTVNALVRQRETATKAREALDDAKAAYAELTSQIQQLDDAKAAAIENAKLPIPGLTLEEDGLMLNGLPLDQASGREKLETAVRIGMAMNPELKLIVAEEGSLLDDEGLATLEALAEKHGFLVVIEKVTNGEKVGFTIEDGSLVS